MIIGVGVKTLKYFIMSDFRPPERFLEVGGRRVILKPVFGDGDGTVPLQGSEISTADRTYYIPYVERWGPDDSSSHADLPSNETVQEIVWDIIDGRPPDPNKYALPNPKAGTELKDLEPGVDFNLHSAAYLNITDQSTGRKLGLNGQGGIDETLPSGTFLAIEGVEYASIADINRTLGVTVTGIQAGKFTLDVNIRRPSAAVTQFSYREVPVKKGTIAQVTMTPSQVSVPPPLTVTTDGRTTTIPASIGNEGGPLIPGGAPIPTGPLPPITPPSGGIGGTWITPTGDIIELVQNGNRVTGNYRGVLGTGDITGTLDGRTLTGTLTVGQSGIAVTQTVILRLTDDGKLEGQAGSAPFSVTLILSRR